LRVTDFDDVALSTPQSRESLARPHSPQEPVDAVHEKIEGDSEASRETMGTETAPVPPRDLDSIPSTPVAETEAPQPQPETTNTDSESSGHVPFKLSDPPGALFHYKDSDRNLYQYTERYLWLSEERCEIGKLQTSMLQEDSAISSKAAAWSSQTGIGLLYLTDGPDKSARLKGILCLAYATDFVKPADDVFGFTILGTIHRFQKIDPDDPDVCQRWTIAIWKAITAAKDLRSTVESSPGYKRQLQELEFLNVGSAAAGERLSDKYGSYSKQGRSEPKDSPSVITVLRLGK
jgi:hypothetical protein